MNPNFLHHIQTQLDDVHAQGLFKHERVMQTPQDAHIRAQDKPLINLCSNNYLGLANRPELRAAAEQALTDWGFGLASVRFICGTQSIHKQLEQALSEFLGMEDTILYSSCFDANAGLFETLLGPEDAIVSDALNHASIIDGVRLCKAKRFRYKNNDMIDLKKQLEAARAAGARYILIATDGVFSMDGSIAKLSEICDLADEFGALTMVDDSHAVGFMGATGRGTHEHCGVMGRVDLITGTLGKALGGASGGYTSGKAEVISWLRQRSRPYLFSNSLAPIIAATTLKVLEMLKGADELLARLRDNSVYFRQEMTAAGFDLLPGEHAIIPVMLGDAKLAAEMAQALLAEGVYVIGFSYPVVPKGLARIRTQMSAAHTREDLNKAVQAFKKVAAAFSQK